MSFFKYLGVVFHSSGSWAAHIKYVKKKFEKIVVGVVRCAGFSSDQDHEMWVEGT